MKKTYIAAMAAFSLSTVVMAQDAPKQPDDAMVNAAMSALANMDVATRMQLIKQFDKDGDGRLSKDERAAAMDAVKNKTADLEDLRQKHAESIIKKFDKDGDGKLDQQELIVFLDEQRKMFDQFRRHDMRMKNMERNIPKDVLAKYDKDGDGKLSREERRAMFTEARQKHEELMKKFDADGDGKLSETEKDALVKSPEFQSMVKSMMGDGTRMRPPMPPR